MPPEHYAKFPLETIFKKKSDASVRSGAFSYGERIQRAKDFDQFLPLFKVLLVNLVHRFPASKNDFFYAKNKKRLKNYNESPMKNIFKKVTRKFQTRAS